MDFYPFLDKSLYRWKYILTGFCVWIVMGAYYCYDVPTALHNSMQEYFSDEMDKDVFELSFSGLYSLCAFANIFLPFITGRLRDQIGDRSIMITLVTFILLGQGVFAYGILIKSFTIMYLGRILASWGIASVPSNQLSFISPYFKKDHLGLVAGVNELFGTLGSVSVLYLCPKIAMQYGIVASVASGTVCCIYSSLCTSISIMFDKNADKSLLQTISYDEVKEQSIQQNPNQGAVDSSQSISIYQQMRSYSKLFWLVVIFSSLITNSALGFTNISVAFLSEQFQYSENEASEMVALMWLGNALFTPVVGFFVDKYGHRSSLSIFTALLSAIAQLLIWHRYPVLCLFLITFSLSCNFQVAWTCIVYLVRPDALGKAYAFMISCRNIGSTLVPLIVGILRANYGTYYYPQIFLSFLTFIALAISIIIFRNDRKHQLDGFSQEQF